MSCRLLSYIFLKNSLRSLYNILEKEYPTITFEVLIFEIGSLSGAKNFERKFAIRNIMENYYNIYLIDSEDKKGNVFVIIRRCLSHCFLTSCRMDKRCEVV